MVSLLSVWSEVIAIQWHNLQTVSRSLFGRSRSRSGFEKIGRHVDLCFIVCASLNNLGEGIDYSETTMHTTLFKLFALFIFFCNIQCKNSMLVIYFHVCCTCKGLDKLKVPMLKEILKKVFRTIWIHNRTVVWLGLWCLTPLSTIVQLLGPVAQWVR